MDKEMSIIGAESADGTALYTDIDRVGDFIQCKTYYKGMPEINFGFRILGGEKENEA